MRIKYTENRSWRTPCSSCFDSSTMRAVSLYPRLDIRQYCRLLFTERRGRGVLLAKSLYQERTVFETRVPAKGVPMKTPAASVVEIGELRLFKVPLRGSGCYSRLMIPDRDASSSGTRIQPTIEWTSA